jgi:hypothetical protein
MSTGPASRQRRTRRSAKWASTALVLGGASALVAACGTGVAPPAVASLGSTATTTTAPSSPQSGGASRYGDALAYAQCMRSHGEPSFPDPSASGSIQLSGGVDPSSPVFASAQAKCKKLLPGGGPPGSGATTKPAAAALAKMIKVAQCMRSHGIAEFPDPATKLPAKLPSMGTKGGVVSDRDGVILVFPGTLDMQSPQFIRAAAACKFALANH